MADLIKNDLRFFLARAGCIYTKAGLSPPFHLRQSAEAWLLDGIDLGFCVDQIASHLDQHAAFYRSGSGDGTLPLLNDFIRKRWHDLHKPPRARPERTDRIWKRNEERRRPPFWRRWPISDERDRAIPCLRRQSRGKLKSIPTTPGNLICAGVHGGGRTSRDRSPPQIPC
jgi:hypothetical protein